MTLQFTNVVADENVPKEVVDHLKGMGLKEVYWILEKKYGIYDPEVWNLAASKKAVLLTGDLGFLSQLNKKDVLEGPEVIEYSTRGFTKNELPDPTVMRGVIKWVFRNGHHREYDHIRVHVDGTVRTRHQLWGDEKARRKRQ